MTCTYPHCEPGQAGTHCRDECRTCCDGKCNQGRECPLLRDDPDPLRDDMLEAVTKVMLLAIGVVAGGVITISLLANTYEHSSPVCRHSPLHGHLPRRVPDLPAQAITAA